jgi:hypothetical protein
MGQLALRLHVGDTAYVGARRKGESEDAWHARTGWRLERIVAPNSIMELRGPNGPVLIREDRGTEISPGVIVFVGVPRTTDEYASSVARVVFRAPREIPIVREGAKNDR